MQRRTRVYHALAALAVLSGSVAGVIANELGIRAAITLRNEGLRVSNPDLTLPALVFAVGLALALVFELLSWRCDVRHRAEQQHRQIVAALSAIHKDLIMIKPQAVHRE